MTDIKDTQQLHNTFVEPLQVETSNSTTNSNCAKLSPEDFSVDNQEIKKLHVVATLDWKIIYDEVSFVPKPEPLTDWQKENWIKRYYDFKIWF